MGKNLISVIAKELGVEIEEEFRLKGVEGYKFFIDSQGYVQCFSIGTGRFDEEYTAEYDLQYLLKNPNDIIKSPFKPKVDEEYWTYSDTDFSVVRVRWYGDATDCCRKACGCTFRAKEEAIAALPAKYKELTGREWQE